jgi:hypothetical protein
MEGMINSYKTLVREPECKKSLEAPRDRWEKNIKMDLLFL